ncbi:MAG: PAS domain-containing protein [Deltaproteobacteria bacterium]|nr:PAS domain-containing protein [Deltaproteobacteria bacterium]
MRPDAERELRRFRALYDLATAMTGDHSLEKNLQLLVDMSRELLGTDTAYLALLSRDEETLVVEACSGVKSEGFNRLRLPAAARGALLPPGPGKSAANAQNCLEPGGEPAFEILAAEGLLGGLQAPVVSHDHVLGYLFVADRRKSVYTREDQDTLILIANLAAVEVSRKRSEKALEENSERLRAVFQNATDAIFIKDLDLRYLMANGAVEDLLRVPPVEIIGKTDEQILDAESAARSRAIEERVLAGQVLEEELTRKRNGDTAFFHLVRAPLKDPSGAVRGLCGIGRDITALKRLEAGARQASKMEAIGTFSTGIAHDFNNILGIISVNVGMAAQALGEKDPIRRNLDLIREACSRGRDLVRQILRLSAGLEEEKKPVRLSSLLEESIRLLRSSAPPSVEIQSKIRTPEDRVLGDPSQLQQAFINLGANALYAMRETGGLLTVTLEDALLQGGGPEYSPCLNSGRHLRICFEDTGPGMADDVLERAFDPYFTTKPKGEASGMGLSIARGIVTFPGSDSCLRKSRRRGRARVSCRGRSKRMCPPGGRRARHHHRGE